MRDLGYFDLGDLQAIHDKGAYYISRLKLNTRIYIKNTEPEYFKNWTLKKQTEYIQLDMAHMMTELASGKTIEIPDAYISQSQKLLHVSLMGYENLVYREFYFCNFKKNDTIKDKIFDYTY